MITLIWMLVTAAGFMISGVLFWMWEWQSGGMVLGGTWVWMAFPKVVSGILNWLGQLLWKPKAPATKV